ncbi:MAG: hypothetical protein ACE368_03025 [Paracoccaceae bacterium]
MELIADILLISGALGAGFYCVVLSRRLTRFTDLEKGVGGAVAVLSAQVDDMTRTLKSAQGAASGSGAALAELTDRADGVARRLELLVAAMHDLPPVGPAADTATAPAAEARRAPVLRDEEAAAPAPATKATGATPGRAEDAPAGPDDGTGADMVKGKSPDDVVHEADEAPEAARATSGASVVALFRSRRGVEAAE